LQVYLHGFKDYVTIDSYKVNMLRELTERIKGRGKTEDEPIDYRQIPDLLRSFITGNYDNKYRISIYGAIEGIKFSHNEMPAREVISFISESFNPDNSHYFKARFQNYKDEPGNIEKWYIDLLCGEVLEIKSKSGDKMLIESKPTKKMTIDFQAREIPSKK
jgi:hypothetical protein